MPRSPHTIGLPVLSDDIEMPLYTGHQDGRLEQDLCMVARNRLAEAITGGLSQTSKLPCPSWGISAARCRIGSVLAQTRGTVCNRCYALKGRYKFDNVQSKLEERYEGLANPLWTPAMIFQVGYFCDRYFRWFCSGDVQGQNHLRNIFTVARHTPDILHWLPTREIEIARALKDEIPANLVLRVSVHRIDGTPPSGFANTSTVIATRPRHGQVCPAPDQENECQDCRACWDADVENVEYWLH